MTKKLGYIKEEGLAMFKNRTFLALVTVSVVVVSAGIIRYIAHLRTNNAINPEETDELKERLIKTLEARGLKPKNTNHEVVGGWRIEIELERKGRIDSAYSTAGKLARAIWKTINHPLDPRP